MELWEGRALLPALGVLSKPQLARHGGSRVPVRCRRIPPPASEGRGLGPGKPPALFAFLKALLCKAGCCSFPPPLHEILEKSFSSLVIRGGVCFAELGWLLEQRLYKLCAVFIRPVLQEAYVSEKDWLAWGRRAGSALAQEPKEV